MKTKITFNGMRSIDHSIKDSLIKDANAIVQTVIQDEGHLGDVISGLLATVSSLELKIEKLRVIFKEQKS